MGGASDGSGALSCPQRSLDAGDVSGGALVNNSFVGLPSPAGTNSAVLEGKLQSGVAAAVKAAEP